MMHRYFRLEQVADGVWAALAGVNAVIVDLGDETLVFDTFADLASAGELRAAAEQLTGRPPSFVVNSHYHADHVQGNCCFADTAVLIASRVTREAMRERGLGALGRMKAGLEARAADLRNRVRSATESAERAQLEAQLSEFYDLLSNYPTPEDLRYPTLTYEREIAFYGSKRTVYALTFGGAHSPCDAVLWLPDEQILCAADLVIPESDPILTLGEPANWQPILDQMEGLGARQIIPGHGHVVPAAEGYQWMRIYLAEIFRQAAALAASGEGAGGIERMPVPDGCDPTGFRANLRFVIERSDPRKVIS